MAFDLDFSILNTKPDYKDMANNIAIEYNIPTDLFSSLIEHESNWNPRAKSEVGAIGLGQLMPETAKGLGIKDPWDPEQNLRGAAKYLKQQLDTFGGSYKKALAAYNAGPGAVMEYNGIPPYQETINYVKNILTNIPKQKIYEKGKQLFTPITDLIKKMQENITQTAYAAESPSFEYDFTPAVETKSQDNSAFNIDFSKLSNASQEVDLMRAIKEIPQSMQPDIRQQIEMRTQLGLPTRGQIKPSQIPGVKENIARLIEEGVTPKQIREGVTGVIKPIEQKSIFTGELAKSIRESGAPFPSLLSIAPEIAEKFIYDPIAELGRRFGQASTESLKQAAMVLPEFTLETALSPVAFATQEFMAHPIKTITEKPIETAAILLPLLHAMTAKPYIPDQLAPKIQGYVDEPITTPAPIENIIGAAPIPKSKIFKTVPLESETTWEAPVAIPEGIRMEPIKDILEPMGNPPKIDSFDHIQGVGAMGAGSRIVPSKFTTRMRTDPTLAPEIQDKMFSTHEELPNQVVVGRAKAAIEENPDAVLRELKAFEIGQATPDINAKAALMVMKLQDDMQELKLAGNLDAANAKFSDAVEILHRIDQSGTKQGQAIQSLAIFGRFTPEGALRYTEHEFNKAINPKQIEIANKATRDLQDTLNNNNLTEIEKTKLVNRILKPDNIEEKNMIGRIIKLSNSGAIKSEELYPIIAKKLKIPVLTPELADIITEKANIIQTLPENSRARLIASAELLKTIAEQIPPSAFKKLSTYQTISMLLNMKTLGRNIIGNIGYAGLSLLTDAVAAGLDAGLGKYTQTRTTVLPNLRKVVSAAKEVIPKALEEAGKGISLRRGILDQGKYSLPQSRTFFHNKGAVENVLAYGEDFLRYGLQVPDDVIFETHRQVILDQEFRAGKINDPALKEPTPEMIQRANFEASRRIFEDPSKLAEFATKIKRGLNFGQEFGLGDFVLKFSKVPSNLIMRGVDYSPFTLLRNINIIQDALGLHSWDPKTWGIGKMGFKAAVKLHQRELVQSMARALVGTTGGIGLGYWLTKEGIMTGNLPEGGESERKASELLKTAGLRGFQFNVGAFHRWIASGFKSSGGFQDGDFLLTYDWFLPQAMLWATGADIAQSQQERVKTPQQIATESVRGGLTAIGTGLEATLNQPVFSGLELLTRSREGTFPEKTLGALGDLIAVAPSTFIPTIAGQVRYILDPVIRDPYDMHKEGIFKNRQLAQTMLNHVFKKIPGVSAVVARKIDVLGKPIKIESVDNVPFHIFNMLLNPTITAHYKIEPEVQMMLDLYRETGETKQMPRIIGKTIKVNKVTHYLTAREREALRIYTGVKIRELFSTYTDNLGFLDLPQEEQIKLLSGNLTDITKAAKIELLGEDPSNMDAGTAAVLLGGFMERGVAPDDAINIIKEWEK